MNKLELYDNAINDIIEIVYEYYNNTELYNEEDLNESINYILNYYDIDDEDMVMEQVNLNLNEKFIPTAARNFISKQKPVDNLKNTNIAKTPSRILANIKEE